MQIHRLSSEQALASLRSSAEGLSAQEAIDRLAEFGSNRIEEVQGEPLWRRFVREFTHFFAIILWIAALLALIAELYEPNKGMATLGLAIVGVIVVNAVFSFWQEYRAEHAIAALRRLLPHQVQVVRAGLAQVVAAESLVPGDVIALAVGDRVPADCRVLEARAARVNAATITGESHPLACSLR